MDEEITRLQNVEGVLAKHENYILFRSQFFLCSIYLVFGSKGLTPHPYPINIDINYYISLLTEGADEV